LSDNPDVKDPNEASLLTDLKRQTQRSLKHDSLAVRPGFALFLWIRLEQLIDPVGAGSDRGSQFRVRF